MGDMSKRPCTFQKQGTTPVLTTVCALSVWWPPQGYRAHHGCAVAVVLPGFYLFIHLKFSLEYSWFTTLLASGVHQSKSVRHIAISTLIFRFFSSYFKIELHPPRSDPVHDTVCCHCLVVQSCLTLCDPVDCSPPGSSVHGILQARILEWGAMPSSRGSARPTDWTHISWVAGRFFTTEPSGKPPSPKKK